MKSEVSSAVVFAALLGWMSALTFAKWLDGRLTGEVVDYLPLVFVFNLVITLHRLRKQVLPIEFWRDPVSAKGPGLNTLLVLGVCLGFLSGFKLTPVMENGWSEIDALAAALGLLLLLQVKWTRNLLRRGALLGPTG